MKKLNLITALAAGAALLFSTASLVSCGNPQTPVETVTETELKISNSKTYYAGDTVSASDFTVTVQLSDETTKTLTADEFTVEVPEANLSEGKLCRSENSTGHSEVAALTIKHNDLSKNFNITIKDVLVKVTADFTDFATEYNLNDTIDYSKIKVTAYYDEEGTVTEDVSEEAVITEVDVSVAGKTTVTVSYDGKEAAETVEVTVTDPDAFNAPDLSSYFKKYFVTSEEGKTGVEAINDWGSGATNAKNDDGTWTLTSSSAMWGGNPGVVAAFTGLTAGTIAKYEYIIVKVDVTDFETDVSQQGGNYGYNIKVPDVQVDIGQYAVTNDKEITFYAPVSAFGTYPETAVEFALIIGGSGNVKLEEVYFASASDPDAVPVTSITMTSAADSVEKGKTVAFTVKNSKLEDVTADATYEITSGSDTGAALASNVLTAGSAGSVTVKATYTCDDGTFTAESTVTVIDAVNLMTELSIAKTFFASDSSWTENTTNTAVVNDDNTITVTLNQAPSAQWQAQVFVNTNADITAGQKFLFSCTLKGNNGSYYAKVNESAPLGESNGAYVSEGTVISISGTAAADLTDFNFLIDLGPSSAGVTTIEDISFAIVE